MKFHASPLEGLVIIETSPSGDARGRFERLFCEQEMSRIRPGLHVSQVNLSCTQERGSVRGMHFQRPPAAEAKLIRCLRGRVLDVAVDLRTDSPTYLRWHGVELSGDAPWQVFIPEGFAHGFQALTDDVQMLYLHSAPWTPEYEGRLRHDDPTLAIDWPLPVTRVSDADRLATLIDARFTGMTL